MRKQLFRTRTLYVHLLVLISCLLFIPAARSQQEAGNPVIFLDTRLGLAYGEAGGLMAGAKISGQSRNILFSVRYTGTVALGSEAVLLSPFTPFPVVRRKHSLEEAALLAGYRKTKDSYAVSLQTGISYNKFTSSYKDNNVRILRKENHLGIPFELALHFFNEKRQRYRLYQLIPVSRKPVAFSNSFGLVLAGCASRNSFISFGLTFGFGFHKQY